MTVQNTFPTPVRSKTIEVYDFRRPTTLAREHLRALELAFETFSRQWGTGLTTKIRSRCELSFDGVSIRTYDEYASALPAATAMVLVEIDSVTPKAVIQFPASAALSWFTRMLGGADAESESERTFTPVENALLTSLISDACDDLKYSLGPLLPQELAIASVHHTSQFAQAAATGDLMIVATFTVRVGERHDIATVAIPADVLIEELGDANPLVTVTSARDLLERQLSQIPIQVSLQLAPRAITPRQVIDLTVGDLITVPHHSHTPLTIAVEGHALAQASVGSNGSRLACVLVESQEK